MRQMLDPLVMLLLLIAVGVSSLASPVLNKGIHSARDMSRRSADTCADPSLARTFYQGYNGPDTLHVLQVHYAFVNANSMHGPGPALWTFQGAVFQAWPTQQPFTVPLFRLVTPASSDTLFVIGEDAQTPPVVSGFGAPTLIAWVYNTTVCDSVPLMSAVLASETDHYWTTDPDEHAGLLTDGWTDGGVVAYVLPLST